MDGAKEYEDCWMKALELLLKNVLEERKKLQLLEKFVKPGVDTKLILVCPLYRVHFNNYN